MARLIQNSFTGEAKAGEARKTVFFQLLVHFNSDLQNGFTLHCLDLRKIDKVKADINRVKETLRAHAAASVSWQHGPASGTPNADHLRVSYEPYYFNERILFFSYNKLANSTFSRGFSVKRTEPLDSFYPYLLGCHIRILMTWTATKPRKRRKSSPRMKQGERNQ